MLNEDCWKGYKQVGMKTKNGKQVPNCVPESVMEIEEDLRKWFGKGKTGGWDRYNTKGEKVGKCGDAKEGEPYVACLSNEKAAKLGKDGRAAFVKRKRDAQKKAGDATKGGERKKGQKPTFVKTGVSESSKEDSIKELDKLKNDLLKRVNVLVAKKNKLYSNVDITTPMTSDEKKLNSDIANLYSQINQIIKKKKNLKEDWSEKYKSSIDCNNPKGFSQKAHCAGKQKNENMKLTVENKLNLFLEKNVPTDPEKWSYAKAQAKKKFDVYPSAYANGWAAKKYKELGGSWKKDESINEGIENALFQSIVEIISYLLAAGLTAVVGFILKLLWMKFNDSKELVKDLINPSTYQKFTTELSKDSAFNKKFVKLMNESDNFKNYSIGYFLKELTKTKEFTKILDKYYPEKGSDDSSKLSDREKAINTFILNMKVTVRDNGKWLIKNIEKKFPEIDNIEKTDESVNEDCGCGGTPKPYKLKEFMITESDYKFGEVEYTAKNMTPTTIQDLAFAYHQAPIGKLAGKSIDHRIRTARDLARLVGRNPMNPTEKSNQPALLLHLHKNKLVNVEEYKELYNGLIDKLKKVSKYVKNADPASRKDAAVAKMAARADMREAKKYSIGSGYLGNGLTIWNRAEEKNGDYKTIAHISKSGELKIYDKQLPSDIRDMFQRWADTIKKGGRPELY